MKKQGMLSRIFGRKRPEIIAAKTPAEDESIKAEMEVADGWSIGDVILGLYEVIGIHTSGGMGLVYRVHHPEWNMDLAVKSPRGEFFQTKQHRENFVRECEVWISLGLHPHTVSCHYVRTIGGIPRVFAEYVEGDSLKEWSDDRQIYEGGASPFSSPGVCNTHITRVSSTRM